MLDPETSREDFVIIKLWGDLKFKWPHRYLIYYSFRKDFAVEHVYKASITNQESEKQRAPHSSPLHWDTVVYLSIEIWKWKSTYRSLSEAEFYQKPRLVLPEVNFSKIGSKVYFCVDWKKKKGNGSLIST